MAAQLPAATRLRYPLSVLNSRARTVAATLLEFPLDFPVKILGRNEPGLAQEILALVQQHVPDFDAQQMQLRSSREGKYLSLTCTIRAISQTQLDGLYLALTRHPRVVMVL